MVASDTLSSRLLTSKGAPIPLRGVNFEVMIRDIGAWVTVAQHFQNVESQPIEAVYSFPLPEGAAVCGFEVRVEERIIRGRVEEKETAFARYDKAIEERHGAYLVDQDRPNIFTISVGNLLPKQSVVIHIRYVQELDTHANGGRFVIPTTISPRYVPLEQLQTAPASELMHINPPKMLGTLPYGLKIQVDLMTSSPIHSVESPSHPIRCQFHEGHATVELVGENIQLDQDFVLNYTVQTSPVPQILIGKDMGSDGFVAMVNFWPKLEAKQRQPQEFIFLIDRSGSMAGESIQQAKMALLSCLKSLQPGDKFNIYGFGFCYEKLFDWSQPYTPETLTTATHYVQELDADLGGTEIFTVLEYALLHLLGDLPCSLILLTDGQVQNEKEVITLAQLFRGRVRIFTLGIGRGASEYLVRGLARVTDGAAEFIFPGERIEPKVMRQFSRLGLPCSKQVRLDFGGLAVDMLTPVVFPPLFSDKRWTVYARLNHVQSTTVRLEAVIAERSYTWEFTIDPNHIDETPVVPLLFARSAIRDLEEQPQEVEGSRQRERKEESRTRREAIINLGCRYQLMSSQTSFVAIEQRSDGDKTTEIKLRRVPLALTVRWGNFGALSKGSYAEPEIYFCTALFGGHDMSLADYLPTTIYVSDDLLSELIASQNFDGSWSLDEELVAEFGWDFTHITQVISTFPNVSHEDEEMAKLLGTILMTLLVLDGLNNCFSENKSAWQLLARKAEQWLRNLSLMPPLTEPEPLDVAERWQVWFTQQFRA